MIRIALTGLNGYGGHFAEPLLAEGGEEYRLAAVVSRRPEQSEYYEQLKAAGVSFYPNLESCLEQEEIQLVIITTPMHIHYREVMLALRNHASVYCEKPLACTTAHYEEIIAAAKENGQYVAVGFHWSYSPAIRKLKKDLLSGKYGKVQSMKASAIWNRDLAYYSQSDWKGRLFTAQGEPIYESVMNNCAAHSMHNILYLLGDAENRSAQMLHPQARCFRGHDIEGFDTIVLKGETEQHQPLFYAATTAADEPKPASFEISCEKARIVYPAEGENRIAAYAADGKEMLCDYGNPEENRFVHFKEVIHSLKTGEILACDGETVLPFGQITEWVNRNVPIQNFPADTIVKDDKDIRVTGLSQKLQHCYDHMEIDADWN